jgi:hypothetical protein
MPIYTHESVFNRRLDIPPPAGRFAICHRLRRSPETRRFAQGLDCEHEKLGARCRVG